MASDGFTDKNAVFRKLKAKSDNKVFAFLNFNFLYFFQCLCFVLLFGFLFLRSDSDLVGS